MLENRNEPVMDKTKIDRKDDFLQHILKALETFSLDEQNYIMKAIYQNIKEYRMCELEELKVKAEMIDKSITDLG